MKIQTFSLLAGSTACNAFCPYCVAKMTPKHGINQKLSEVNLRNLGIACRFAKESGISTALLTGKGEPTLFPEQISLFMNSLRLYDFIFVELQTNGIIFLQEKEEYKYYLKRWYDLGLTAVAISIVHYDNCRNKENFQPNGPYIDLPELIVYLHKFGFSVRLSCVMFKGGIHSVPEVRNLAQFAKENKVEQLTITPVRAPQKSESRKVAEWVAEHELDEITRLSIKDFLDAKGTKLLPLAHGAVIYDLDGQNICLSDCLTDNKSTEEIRQLIFFPDGHLRYDWQYPGAILL